MQATSNNLLLMVGVTHRTACLALREKLALCGDGLSSAYEAFNRQFPRVELAILSTCNRTEWYIDCPRFRTEEIIAWWSERSGVAMTELRDALIQHEGEQAIQHLFRVAAGLDSMVLGETQILGQVRRAYEYAQRQESVGPVLHKVFQTALNVARQARAATGIDEGRVSIGSVAVDFARQIFPSFDDKVIVAIGAGEMAKVTLRHLQALRPAKLWITNRTAERAHRLARQLDVPENRGGARVFEELDQLLVEADIVLTSTGSLEPIITMRRLQPLLRLREGRPLFMIDIALPRDVEPGVGSLPHTFLYNLDDLQRVVERTFTQRESQVRQCEVMLMEAARSCVRELRDRHRANYSARGKMKVSVG